MLQYYSDHQMQTRLTDLMMTATTLPLTTLRRRLEQWDADQGRAMKYAEKLLERPRKPYEWSPTLRNHGLLYRYWKLRMREKTHSENYSATYRRMEQQTQHHDTTFILPFRDIPLPLSEIQHQLKHAKQALKSSQRNSLDLRFRCYTDMLAVYEADTNPSSKRESTRKAKIVLNTIKAEQSRTMYTNIRNTVKPNNTNGSLAHLLVPHHTTSPDFPDNFQEFLASTDKENIQWDSILDKNSINRNLLRFNREHF